MPERDAIGWDLGGAHLKAARREAGGVIAEVVQLACPLWQGMDHLERALDRALTHLGPAPEHAITMTGEMVDLFSARAQGVAELVRVATACLGEGARFYAGEAGLVAADRAAARPQAVASANWHASARFLAARLPAALLVDVGSTTTDLIAVADGAVRARAADDAGRLATHELVYTGVVRTPLMALAPAAPFAGTWVALMAEHFATSADVHRLTGDLPEDADQHPAADQGEKTPTASARRLARMIGRDLDCAPLAAWQRLAAWFSRAQGAAIERACDTVLSAGALDDGAPLVGAGCGRFLVRRVAQRLGRPYRDFAEFFPGARADAGWIATCASAVALACLAGEGAARERSR